MFPQNPKLIEIMMDGSKIGQNRGVDAGIVGNSKAILRQIIDELKSTGYKSHGKAWVEEVITEDQSLKAADEPMLNSDQSPIHPMRVMKELRDFLDRDATVIGDGGDIVTFAARVLNINEPGHWLDPGQFGCLGAGSGFAAAAQLARPGKQVCIVYGDGGFGLTGFDVESYVRFNLPIVSVLGNNGKIEAFIELIDSPVFLNAMGRGSIPSDHPNIGSLGRRYGLVKSDTVILIGTPIDFRLGYGAESMFPQNPKLIEIMMDGSKIGQNRGVDAGIVGNSKAILRQIIDELKSTGYKSPGKSWVEEVITEDQALKAAER